MARKKTSMQSEVELVESQIEGVETGEQMTWLELDAEFSKEIKPIAKQYKSIITQRISLTAREKDLKEQLRSMIKEAGLQRLSDGSIKFKCDGLKVELLPQDEKVKVTEDNDD